MEEFIEEFIEGWVTELSPIHETVAKFEKGGPECGKTILWLYNTLFDAEQSAYDLQGEVDGLQDEVDDLQREVDELREEISELKKESGNGK